MVSRLVLDCANGAAFKLAPELFERLGASVTTINNQPDGRNINLECGSLHIESLQTEVVKKELRISESHLTATQIAHCSWTQTGGW